MFSALFSFDGRLNRAPFWGYSLLLVAVIIIVQLVILSTIMGPTMAVLMERVNAGADMEPFEIVGMFMSLGPQLGWAALIVQIVASFPAAALSVKRRHDRDKSGIDVLIYVGLAILVSVMGVLGIGMVPTEGEGGITIMTPQPWMQVVQLAVGIFGLYLFIVLGFLRGTIGPNSYGPDPLGG